MLCKHIHFVNYFQNPSDEAKPWTFWYWMFGAVSKEGITADLGSNEARRIGRNLSDANQRRQRRTAIQR